MIGRIGRIGRIGQIGLIGLLLAATAAAETLPVLQSSFTGGELSPLAAARLDASRYYSSAALLENMIAIPPGPAVRRPGTIYAGLTRGNSYARLVPWRYSANDAYVLEFTNHHMRVWRNHGLVTNADTTVYDLTTVLGTAELDGLQFWQSADVCYIACATNWPQKLTRVDHNDWSIADAAIDDGPWLPENLTATTITASATTGAITLTSSAPLFNALHEGSYWRLRDLVGIQSTAGTLTAADSNSTELTCQAGENFQWEVHGTFVGTVELQLSYDAGATWAPYTVLSSTSSATTTEVVYDNDTGQDVNLRVRCTDYTSGTISYQLWTHAYMHTGVVKVTGYTNSTSVPATVVRTLASTEATVYWSEGAWSAYRGYPRAIAGYSDRLVFAGTTYEPVTLWFSRTGDYETFDPGDALADDAFTYTLGRSEQDPIVWVVNHQRRGLLAGTTGAILELEPLDGTASIKPDNPPSVANVIAVPAAAVPPLLADNVLVVLQRGGRQVRELLYSADVEGLVAPNLSMFAEHLFAPQYTPTNAAGSLVNWCYQSSPYPIVWATRSGDGALVSLVYDRNYQMVSWSHHHLGGTLGPTTQVPVVKSVCTIPGSYEDELWLVDYRMVGTASWCYFVEYLAPWHWGTSDHDAHFVDCGSIYDGAPVTTLSGMSQFQYPGGAMVAVAADAAALAARPTVGTITLTNAASVIHVGYAYNSTLQTVRYDFTGPSGTTWGRRKTIPRAVVSFYQSQGARVGPDTSRLQDLDWLAAGAAIPVGVPPLFTGDREILFPTNYATDGAQLMVQQAQPLPLTVRAIQADVEVH